MWDVARRQRQLWNNLVSLVQATHNLLGEWNERLLYNPGDEVIYAGKRWRVQTATNSRPGRNAPDWLLLDEISTQEKQRRREAWSNFDDWAKAAVAQSGLDWVNGPDVFDRLRTAVRKGRVRFHSGLDSISISHRFTGGGLPLAKIVDNPRVSRLRFSLPSSWTFAPCAHSPHNDHPTGRFALAGGVAIDFTFIPHRPLPLDTAILKRATWIGELAGTTGSGTSR